MQTNLNSNYAKKLKSSAPPSTTPTRTPASTFFGSELDKLHPPPKASSSSSSSSPRPQSAPPPVLSPTDTMRISKFMQFRQKWEANVKKKDKKVVDTPAKKADPLIKKVEKAAAEIGTLPVERISDTIVHRITVAKDSPTKILRDPLASRRSPTSFAKATTTKRLIKQPIIIPPKKTRGGHHKMPNSWQIAHEQGQGGGGGTDKVKRNQEHYDKNKLHFTSTLSPLVPEEYMAKNRPPPPLIQFFTSPLELQYPFHPSLTSKLKMYSWNSQKQAGDNNFGWFNPTNSLLNPILPGLPRFGKPKEGGRRPSSSDSSLKCFNSSNSGVSTVARQRAHSWETPTTVPKNDKAVNEIIEISDDDDEVF